MLMAKLSRQKSTCFSIELYYLYNLGIISSSIYDMLVTTEMHSDNRRCPEGCLDTPCAGVPFLSHL